MSEAFMSFGRMPLANGFLSQDKFADEYFFELSVSSCPRRGMFQLM
jgi:methylation protein EvaC